VVWPDRILRIKIHRAIPDRINQRRERHGRAGVAGLRRLDRINRKGTDSVDGQLFHFFISHKFYFRYLMPCPSFGGDVVGFVSCPAGFGSVGEAVA
jgi:hypothetical protein